jgi:isoaspartyl peptidase/L-asparaginase-like protein (Ntn-hydrolase superfamily)
MKTRLVLVLAAIATLTAGILFLIGGEVNSSPKSSNGKWTETFNLDDCNFTSTGSNTYFIQQVLDHSVFL